MYKASITGGGESSNQYISSMIFLAYHAKTCYHIPPPPSLMQLMEANCRPQTKHWTSSNTWPSKEWLAVEEEIAFIILMLSPSMTNSEKPASMENSRAFLQAKAFASSLLFTLRPFHRHCCHYLTSLIANYCTKARAFQVRKNGSIKIQFIKRWRGKLPKIPAWCCD